jgi:cytochrome c-type biogenesis protein CcmH/NrfF
MGFFRTQMLFLALLLCTAFPAGAQETNRDTYAQEAEISATILSPYCPGRLLRDCPSGAAQELRKQIRTSLETKSTDEVMEELYVRFGDQLSATPKKSGFGLLAWILPPVFLVGGLLFILWWISRNRGQQEAQGETLNLDKDILARIEREVSKKE